MFFRTRICNVILDYGGCDYDKDSLNLYCVMSKLHMPLVTDAACKNHPF